MRSLAKEQHQEKPDCKKNKGAEAKTELLPYHCFHFRMDGAEEESYVFPQNSLSFWGGGKSSKAS